MDRLADAFLIEAPAPDRYRLHDLLRLFADDERGGFFTTGTDAEALIVRPKDVQDNATPSENSLACNGLLRLAALTGESRYEDAAARWIRVMAPLAGEHATAFAYLLGALERRVSSPLEVAIVGGVDDPATIALRAEVTHRLLPSAVTLTAEPGVDGGGSPLLADRPLVDGRPTAYVCERYACRQPVTELGIPIPCHAQDSRMKDERGRMTWRRSRLKDERGTWKGDLFV